ncbi:MAG: hypothetical protein HRU03_04220, partial [Nanoarchaeales archaeon]|nr:hypothetical protein [Nanoarchaeales archaeon]
FVNFKEKFTKVFTNECYEVVEINNFINSNKKYIFVLEYFSKNENYVRILNNEIENILDYYKYYNKHNLELLISLI